MCIRDRIYVSQLFEEKRITYKDLMLYSNQIANYLKSEGIRKGDRLIVALQRAYQFWYVFLALNKIGAIPVPVISQLREKDIRQREMCIRDSLSTVSRNTP